VVCAACCCLCCVISRVGRGCSGICGSCGWWWGARDAATTTATTTTTQGMALSQLGVVALSHAAAVARCLSASCCCYCCISNCEQPHRSRAAPLPLLRPPAPGATIGRPKRWPTALTCRAWGSRAGPGPLWGAWCSCWRSPPRQRALGRQLQEPPPTPTAGRRWSKTAAARVCCCCCCCCCGAAASCLF
jgi:hypothetical protein